MIPPGGSFQLSTYFVNLSILCDFDAKNGHFMQRANYKILNTIAIFSFVFVMIQNFFIHRINRMRGKAVCCSCPQNEIRKIFAL